MKYSDLVFIPQKDGDISYSEAVIGDDDPDEYGNVYITIRRYSRNVFVAVHDDRRAADGDESYTQDGEGCGIIPGPEMVIVILKVPIEDFQRDFDNHMQVLYKWLKTNIESYYWPSQIHQIEGFDNR